MCHTLSFLTRRGGSQQFSSVATCQNGTTGGGGGPGCWPPSSPSPPSQCLGWRRVRGRRPHVHHERFRRSHGTLSRGCSIGRQLRIPFSRLPDGVLAGLQPKTPKTHEEDLRLHLWTRPIYSGQKNLRGEKKNVFFTF